MDIPEGGMDIPEGVKYIHGSGNVSEPITRVGGVCDGQD